MVRIVIAEHVRLMACPWCDALPGDPCTVEGVSPTPPTQVPYHEMRYQAWMKAGCPGPAMEADDDAEETVAAEQLVAAVEEAIRKDERRRIVLGVLGYPPTTKPPSQEQIRASMLEAMSDYSQNHWAAGWLGDLDRMLFQSANPLWKAMAELAGGWPLGYRAEDGWVDLETAEAHYKPHGPTEPPNIWTPEEEGAW